MMTFGSFMKWGTWKCLVVRNPSRKNVFPFGIEEKTNAGFKPPDDFHRYLVLMEKPVAR